MAETERPRSIEEQAAEWAVRAAYGDMPQRDETALEAWLAADRRHRGAYLRAQAGLLSMEDMVSGAATQADAVNDNVRTDTHDDPGVGGNSPRLWHRTAGKLAAAALAACLLLAIGLNWRNGPSVIQVAHPGAGEMALADGSTALLATGSRVTPLFDNASRTIILDLGEATFHVATDNQRPFIVKAGDISAEATGTVYSVRRVGETGGTVRVLEGTVLVWQGADRSAAVALHQGEALTLNPVVRLAKSRPAQPALPAGGSEISLDNVTIAASATRFNSVNSAKVIVEDPTIGETVIVGLFKPDDPEGFAEAAAALTGAQVIRRDGNFVIEK